jgi:hypothetical protein
MHFRNLAAIAAVAALLHVQPVAADVTLPSEFSNQGTIGNTRHNLTQRQTSGGGPAGASMDQYRNDYREVCVYCHTPHGANTNIALPLWNRTVRATTYTLYNQGSLSGTVTQPGANSLACLSCHDGQTAVDSIVNMPGSGGYNEAQKITQDNGWLNSAWTNSSGIEANSHFGLKEGAECLGCHAPGAPLGGGATSFVTFAIGTDLSNDHPVGVTLPTGEDWKVPGGTKNNIKYFDANGDNALSKGDIRFYDTGEGAEVECASCHDPHGVPSGTASSTFNATFLRVSNTGSAVCLTCHNK